MPSVFSKSPQHEHLIQQITGFRLIQVTKTEKLPIALFTVGLRKVLQKAVKNILYVENNSSLSSTDRYLGRSAERELSADTVNEAEAQEGYVPTQRKPESEQTYTAMTQFLSPFRKHFTMRSAECVTVTTHALRASVLTVCHQATASSRQIYSSRHHQWRGATQNEPNVQDNTQLQDHFTSLTFTTSGPHSREAGIWLY